MVDPMYRQIAEDLRRQIEAGELPPGAQLRTELELREKYDASRNTVRDAIKWLITRGLVETRPGQGTFVVEKIVPFVTTLTGDPRGSASDGDDLPNEVKASLRRPDASLAPGGDPAGRAPRWPRNCDRTGTQRGQPASAALYRRHAMVAADLFLSAEPGRAGARAAHRRPATSQRGRRVPARDDRHQAGRLPGHDHGASAGRDRGRFFGLAGRWPRLCDRNPPDRVSTRRVPSGSRSASTRQTATSSRSMSGRCRPGAGPPTLQPVGHRSRVRR